jgi:hypothetical protein
MGGKLNDFVFQVPYSVSALLNSAAFIPVPAGDKQLAAGSARQ